MAESNGKGRSCQQLFDLLGDLSALADRDGEFKLPTGRGDEACHTARSHV